MGQYFRIILISLSVSLLLVPVVKIIAHKFQILDHPKSRKIHKQPMPKLGGPAMYLAFVIGTLASYDYNEPLKGILIGSTIILVVGLIDDIRHLRASIRLAFQVIACIVVILYGVRITVFPNNFINIAFTIFGLLGITNALNFLDNMDGLAAGITAICCFAIFAIAYKTGQRWLAFLSLSLLGSCIGFLRYNFKPAKIFMGDSGSTFLGFTVAAMSIMATWSHQTIVAITVPVLILGIMIFDTTMITILRIAEGKVRTPRQWLEHADTDHISHRLVDMGLSQREAVMFIYICNLILAAVAISIPKDGVKTACLAATAYIFISSWGIWKLHNIKINRLKVKP